MRFSISRLALIAAAATAVAATPIADEVAIIAQRDKVSSGNSDWSSDPGNGFKRDEASHGHPDRFAVHGFRFKRDEVSYGNPDLVTDQGNRFKLNFGSTEGHPNACPGHYICYIGKNGDQHDDVSLGDPDDMVDEGNRWVSRARFNERSVRSGPEGSLATAMD